MSAFGTGRTDRPSLVAGALAGALAWLAGYAVTYLFVASVVRQSGLNRVLTALDGEPAIYELAGWVFYNAHFVETVVSGVPFVGGGSLSFVGGEEFSALPYLVPVLALLLVGAALALVQNVSTADAGALTGLSVLPGYFLLSVAGVVLFEVTVGNASSRPDPLAAIVLAGIVYPALFGSAGGALGGLLGGRRRRSDGG